MKKLTKPKKASQVSSKGKAAPAQSKPRGGASAATGRPPWNSPNWGPALDKFLWGEFEKLLATSKRTPKRQEELRKRYREKLTGWIKNMVKIRAASDAKWASMLTPPQSQVQTAEAECEALIAAHLQEMEAKQDLEQHRTTQALGRRAFKALTLQDAGYSLAAEIAGGDGQLEISLEALALWLKELLVPAEHGGFRVFVDTEFFSELTRFVVGSDIGDSIPEKESDTGQTPRPRWQTMPEGSFLHFKRPPHRRLHKGKTRTQVKNASEVRLKTESEEWLWRELARSAIEDAETAKALHHLLGWHQDAAMMFLQRFLASRNSIQNGVKERLLKTARGLALGNEELINNTTKEDRDRLRRDHPA
jgi:hypothetical protein